MLGALGVIITGASLLALFEAFLAQVFSILPLCGDSLLRSPFVFGSQLRHGASSLQ